MPRKLLGGLLAVALFATGVSVAWALGELSQKAGVDGCVSDSGTNGTCEDGNGLGAVNQIALSDDGENVYAVGAGSDSLTAFDRDPATGNLQQKPGGEGCFTNTATPGCTDAMGLDQTEGIAVSPGGRHVYVTGNASSTIAIFARSTANGELDQVGCLSDAGGECADSSLPLGGADGIAISADGRDVYVGAETSDAVSHFTRDTTTGMLTPVDCIAETAGVCTDGRVLNFESLVDIRLTPDGKQLLAAAVDAKGVAILDRDATTGALSQRPGVDGCVAAGDHGGTCAVSPTLQDPSFPAVSPDGKSVYVTTSGSNAVTTLARNATTGGLTHAGCLTRSVTAGCSTLPELFVPEEIAVSPDGATVYFASTFTNTVFVLDRDAATGAITLKPGQDRCVSETGDSGACEDGRALSLAYAITVSPDGANAYVGALSAASIVVLDRAGATTTTPTTATTATTTTTTTSGGGGAPAATPPPPATTTARPPVSSAPPLAPVSPKASAFVTLPSAKRCVSRRRLRIALRIPRGQRVKGARVLVDGRRRATRSASRFTAPVNLKGLPKGTFTVTVEVTLADGRRLTQRRRLRTCAARRRRG